MDLGTIIADRYRLDAIVGEGGMGRVFRAEHLTLARPVAVKLIARELAGRAEAIARFAREARAQARLHHPNVVSTLDFGDHDGRPYLVLEYVAGRTLEDILATERLAVSRAVQLATQIASGLGAAHAAGIVHRDVKPANVLVSGAPGDEHAKVGDFGLAALRDEASRLTHVGQAVGTPVYLAPEQFLGKPVDARADVYALGCVLYELLVGRPPYGDGSPVELLHRHLEAPRLRARAHNPGVPEALDELVFAMLAKDAADRPADAGEVARRLRTIAVLTTPPPAPPHAVVVAVLDVAAAQLAALRGIVEAAGGSLVFAPDVASRRAGTAQLASFPHPEAAVHAAERIAELAGNRVRLGVHASAAGDPALARMALRLAMVASRGEVLVSHAVHAAVGLGIRAQLAPRGRFEWAGRVLPIFGVAAHGEPNRRRSVETTGIWRDGSVVFACSCGAAGRIAAPGHAFHYDAACPACGATCRIEVIDGDAVPEARPITISDAIALPQGARDSDRDILAQLSNLD